MLFIPHLFLLCVIILNFALMSTLCSFSVIYPVECNSAGLPCSVTQKRFDPTSFIILNFRSKSMTYLFALSVHSTVQEYVVPIVGDWFTLIIEFHTIDPFSRIVRLQECIYESIGGAMSSA